MSGIAVGERMPVYTASRRKTDSGMWWALAGFSTMRAPSWEKICGQQW